MDYNLTRETAERFLQSWGGWSELAEFLTDKELVQMQALNKLAYRLTVPRAAKPSPFLLTKKLYFTHWLETEKLYKVNVASQECCPIRKGKYDFYRHSTVQDGDDLYSIEWDSDKIKLYANVEDSHKLRIK